MGAGYPINWALPAGSKLQSHPLYIKYSSTKLEDINTTELRTNLGGILPRADTAEVCAYLSWVLRSCNLLTPGP